MLLMQRFSPTLCFCGTDFDVIAWVNISMRLQSVVGYLHSSKDSKEVREQSKEEVIYYWHTLQTGNWNWNWKLQRPSALLVMVEQFDGGAAGGNLMLKCIYSSQMISKSDKDPAATWRRGVLRLEKSPCGPTAAKFYEILWNSQLVHSQPAGRKQLQRLAACQLTNCRPTESESESELARVFIFIVTVTVTVTVTESHQNFKLISFRFTCAKISSNQFAYYYYSYFSFL